MNVEIVKYIDVCTYLIDFGQELPDMHLFPFTFDSFINLHIVTV